jgi:hypothetical protein
MRIKDETHLDFIRGLPCVICHDNTTTEAAHVRMPMLRAAKKITGIGIKPNDCWTVPLCSRHHRRQHEIGSESKFWGDYGINPVEIAAFLYCATGDPEAGEEIVKRCKC